MLVGARDCQSRAWGHRVSRTRPKLTDMQRLLIEQCQVWGPVAELQFAKPRRWRIDVAFPLHLLAVEIDGGVWSRGRHSRGAGMLADMEKTAALAARGWRLIRCSPQHVADGTALAWVREAIAGGAHGARGE